MLTLLVLMPFMLLSLIAPGTMLARDPSSQGVMMVLCGDSLPVSMMIDARGELVPAPADGPPLHDKKPACGWAMQGQPGLVLGAASLPPVTAAAYPAYLSAAITQYLRQIETPAFFARGPPVTG